MQVMESAVLSQRTQRRRHERLTDRWIDKIAASYGMPRIVLLRQLRTMPHLARAIAAVIAEQERVAQEEAAAAARAKQQQDNEMRAYLAELKREQDEGL